MKLFETIKFEKGQFVNLDYHSIRMNKSRQDLFNSSNHICLKTELSKLSVPQDSKKYKCRVVYNTDIQNVEFELYKQKRIRSLQLVYSDDIEYNYKYLNREAITKLLFEKGDADDIIIVKRGLITDASYANLIFYDGNNWHTPKSPLLEGTQRARLLDLGYINSAIIKPKDLKRYTLVRLINAMLNYDDVIDIDISKIYGIT